MCSNSKRSDIYWNWTTSNNPSDVDLLQTWQWLYEMINASNTIIYYADKDVDWRGGSDTPENNKLRVVAEARAIRGWAYRRLDVHHGAMFLLHYLSAEYKNRLGTYSCR